MTTRWPSVVSYLLATLPALPSWAGVPVFDTDPLTASAPMTYAVVGRTSDDNTSGNFVRLVEPSGLINESGTVRVHIVTQTGATDPVAPAGVRSDGFALLGALEDWLITNQTLGGLLGSVATVDLTVDVMSVANQNGVAQSLIVSVNYTSLA